MYIVRFYVGVLKNINKRNFLRTEKMERFHQILAEQQSEIETKNKELTTLYEQFNKQNQDLLLQKELLQTQNDELTRAYEELIDSIYYTKRIQVALLPRVERIKPHFADFMILYKPKEILSGDFYWFANVNGYSFLIVADCTGHGIPGAFMTVIGNDLLNHIVKEERTFSPKDILKRLDEELLKTLQQQEGYETENISDGMDMAICRINKKENEICFAGAKRPLFVVNEQGIKEIKGSRYGIGGISSTEKVFEEHRLLADNQDIFYMSSDGFYRPVWGG
jgi:serine phosphatase RsbU (regulator of sigma subunit)